MKLLFSLILIFSIALNVSNSTKTLNPLNINIKESNPTCFSESSFVGFTTAYIFNSINAFFPGENGQPPKQDTFYESGTISYDFQNQLYYNQFYELDISSNLTTTATTWIFGKNSTQYFIPTNDATCYIVSKDATLPSQMPLLFPAGSSEIGITPTQVLSITDTKMANYTAETLLVTSDCTPMIYSVSNLEYVAPGEALMNFFFYATEPNENLFQLPSLCAEPTPVESSKLSKSTKSILNMFQ
ncbi:hypothetical protein RB653_009353 [Dictyostelium firmibasis]|uniref:Uncharacterized protein n=1 Tax=Dictyostelium firmibasis TaxID=79012 RepID=A0AAN7U1M6_9MYCE